MAVSRVEKISKVGNPQPQDKTKKCSKFDYMLHQKINELKGHDLTPKSQQFGSKNEH